jgi:hypothetical protein
LEVGTGLIPIVAAEEAIDLPDARREMGVVELGAKSAQWFLSKDSGELCKPRNPRVHKGRERGVGSSQEGGKLNGRARPGHCQKTGNPDPEAYFHSTFITS